MGVADRAGVLAFLKQNEGAESPSLAEQRARIESLADFFPVAEGAEIEPATLGGIAGGWARGRRLCDRLAQVAPPSDCGAERSLGPLAVRAGLPPGAGASVSRRAGRRRRRL